MNEQIIGNDAQKNNEGEVILSEIQKVTQLGKTLDVMLRMAEEGGDQKKIDDIKSMMAENQKKMDALDDKYLVNKKKETSSFEETGTFDSPLMQDDRNSIRVSSREDRGDSTVH